MQIEFSEQAKSDVDRAFEWYASRSLGAAEGFVRALEHSVSVVGSGPEIWPEFEAGTRRYVFRRYPFSLIFKVVDQLVIVVAVAPHRKRPGYWK